MYNVLVKENIYFKKIYAKIYLLDLTVQYLWLILSINEGYQWKQYGRIMNGTCIRQNQPDIEGLRMAICLWSWIILFSFLHMFNYFSMKEKEKSNWFRRGPYAIHMRRKGIMANSLMLLYKSCWRENFEQQTMSI